MPALAHDRLGSGEPLVLVHPLGADRGVWKPVLAPLAEHHDVIAVDLPGFGQSPPLPEGVEATASALAAPICATLDSLGLDSAHVAGISLGGWVALEFGKSGRALGVTAFSPAGFWARPLGPRPEVARFSARRIAALAGPLLLSARARRLVLSGVTRHPERVPARDAARLVRAYARAAGFEAANSAMRAAVFEGIDRISVPVTLAWADHDRLVRPPRAAPPGVSTVVLRDCGHIPTWDGPEQVVAAIRNTTERAAAGGAVQSASRG